MGEIVGALFERAAHEKYYNPPWMYLLAALALAILSIHELASGVAYLKFGQTAVLSSTAGTVALGVHLVFCVIAAAVFVVKLKRNLREG